MGGAGGQGSNDVKYGDYIKVPFSTFLMGFYREGDDFSPDSKQRPSTVARTPNVMDASFDAVLNNPYIGKIAYDVTTLVDKVETEAGNFETLVDAISPTMNIDTFAKAVTSTIDNDILLDDTIINEAVDAFDQSAGDRMNRRLNTFAGTMAEIGGVHSTAFIQGMALIQQGHMRDVANYESQLKLQERQTSRSQLIGQLTQVAVNMQLNKISLQHQATVARMEQLKLTAIAEDGEVERQIELDASEATWDQEVLLQGLNGTGAVAGIATISKAGKKPGQAGQAIAGAAIGAGAGALIGAEVGAIGGPVGAAVGGVLGLASGILG